MLKTKFNNIIIVIVFCFVGVCLLSTNVSADGSGSGGIGGGAITTTCNTAKHVKNTKICTNEYGGASWHIFDVRNSPKVIQNLDVNKPLTSPKSRISPTYNTSENFMSDGGYDFAFASKCPASKYEYYLTYVYDGWNGKKMTGGPVYYGPLAWGVVCGIIGDHCNYPVYHNKNAFTYNQAVAKIGAGQNVNTLRITGTRPKNKNDSTFESAEALKFYRDYCKSTGYCSESSTNIPYWVGYFCIAKSSYIEFQGRSSVGNRTIGYSTNGGSGGTHVVKNCSATNGCVVHFKHEIKRTKGNRTTPYTVIRNSNIPSNAPHGVATGVIKRGTSGNNNGQTVANSAIRLYPGMMVCETLSFEPTLEGYVNNRICAVAAGNAQAKTLIDIKVRNQDVTKYNEYQESVYAKPGDKVDYKATYNPELQSYYNLQPQLLRIDGQPSTPYSGWGAMTTMFNVYKNPGWNNAFGIDLSKDDFASSSLVANYKYANGVSSSQSPTPNIYNESGGGVTADDAGRKIEERAMTGLNAATQTTPTQITFSTFGNSVLSDVSTTPKSAKATAFVPYNFNTGTEVTTSETQLDPNDKETHISTPVYAGEVNSVDIDVDILEKQNNLTTNDNGSYVTRAKDVKSMLVVYDPAATGGRKNGGTMNGNRNTDVCAGYFGHAQDEVNCGYSSDIVTDMGPGSHSLRKTFLAQDRKAGGVLCVASAVFPANSGADANWNDLDYSNSWRISDSKCFTVAKKPSLEVWGGNVYSRGKISTSVSKKNHVRGYTDYKVGTLNDRNYVFGSFGESGLVTSAQVSGFASGASTGFSQNNNGDLWPIVHPSDGLGNNGMGLFGSTPPGPGGSSEFRAGTTICNRSPLTIPNYPCSSEMVGLINTIGSSAGAHNAEQDKNNIIAKFIRDVEPNESGIVRLNNKDRAQPDGTYYYGGDSDLTIPNVELEESTIQFVYSNNNIMLGGDIYHDGEYTKLHRVPKLVVYAKNIVIGCNVSRIDALLIADEKVITCDNFENDFVNTIAKAARHINSHKNSNQLFINGAVVAKNLIANRTYGAATGANSIVPAEIINFDPTLYLWGGLGNDEGNDGALNVSSVKELSPRR